MSDLGIEILQKPEVYTKQKDFLTDWVERVIVLGQKDPNFKSADIISRRMMIMRKMGQIQGEKMALRDVLTDLPNRRAYNEKIEELNKKSVNYSLLLVDIDDFKKINDTYGHDKGDEALVFVANTLLTNTRQIRQGEEDFVYRWGGEEFAIILTNVYGNENLYNISEKLRGAIKQISPSVSKTSDGNVQETSMNISVSIGGSTIGENRSTETLFKVVDNNLLEAKKQGKDRSIIT